MREIKYFKKLKINSIVPNCINQALGDCCMGSGLFHLTLSMIRLNGDAGVDEATKLVEDLQEELQELIDKRGDRKPGKIQFLSNAVVLNRCTSINFNLDVTPKFS